MATPRVPDRQDSPGETVAEDHGLPIAHAGSIALTMTIVLGVGRTRQASYPDSAGQTSRSDRSLTASGQYPLPPRHQPWRTNRAAALRSHTATSGITCNVSCSLPIIYGSQRSGVGFTSSTDRPVLTWGCLDPELVIRVAGQPDRRLGARGLPCAVDTRFVLGIFAGPQVLHSGARTGSAVPASPRSAASRPAAASYPGPGSPGRTITVPRRDRVPLALRAVSLATGRHDRNLGSQAPDLGPLGCRRRTLVPDRGRSQR